MADGAQLERSGAGAVLAPRGRWTLTTLDPVFRRSLESVSGPVATIDCSGVEALDTAGALVLRALAERVGGAEVAGLRPEFLQLYRRVDAAAGRSAPPHPRTPGFVYRVGFATAEVAAEARRYLAFIGELAVTAARSVGRLRWRPMLGVFETAGWGALPILGLLSFLIGVVVAYQAGVQLRDFGANIFIADLIGIAVLREFGPLLTAIIVAGRTGSAFTAELGTMKVTEEIDALRTIGISPLEMLVLPKVVALALVLPLLTVFADVFGVLGGMFMAQQMLDVGYHDFLDRLDAAVDLSDFLTGLGKAPVFALLIATVGCHQGLQVGTSADSIGRHVTTAVVQAIFLIIVADAAFSVAFNMLGL